MHVLYLVVIYIFICLFETSAGFFWRQDCIADSKYSIIQGLKQNISGTLYGQHIIEEAIIASLDSHLQGNPSKALVLSFHGPPGCGKNFVATKMAHHLFEKGTSSKAYVYFSGAQHFQLPHKLKEYHDLLKAKIKSTVESCERAMFVFDEADKMLDGMFTVLKPYLDHIDSYQGVDYRKSVFIFISNIGFEEISRICYKQSKVKGRANLKLRDFHNTLLTESFNEHGGMQFSSLLKSHLVDHFLPFLPLEREHVKKCIEAAARQKWITFNNELLNYVLESLTFKGPDENFSSSGCKRIDTLVSYYDSRKRFRDEF